MQGIQIPVIYIGAALSSFSWHVEDGVGGLIAFLAVFVRSLGMTLGVKR